MYHEDTAVEIGERTRACFESRNVANAKPLWWGASPSSDSPTGTCSFTSGPKYSSISLSFSVVHLYGTLPMNSLFFSDSSCWTFAFAAPVCTSFAGSSCAEVELLLVETAVALLEMGTDSELELLLFSGGRMIFRCTNTCLPLIKDLFFSRAASSADLLLTRTIASPSVESEMLELSNSLDE